MYQTFRTQNLVTKLVFVVLKLSVDKNSKILILMQLISQE